MPSILFEYDLSPGTWAWLSALLTLGTFFKFRRFWSVRNLDLVGLIAFSPAILLIFRGDLVRGFGWLFAVGALFLIRLILDPIMVRRPLLEPNLNASGLTFTGAALMVFLVGSLLTNLPPERLEHVLARRHTSSLASPGCVCFYYVASFANAPKAQVTQAPAPWQYPTGAVQIALARSILILTHLFLVLGIVLVGYRHFDNIHTGVAAASLYLLLPYTSQLAGRIDHVVPAALLVWALVVYRRPVFSGLLAGLVAAIIFYPLFLLPLWCSFYWRRGLLRFLGGAAFALVGVVLLVVVLSGGVWRAWGQIGQMFGSTVLDRAGSDGFWEFHELPYRIPLLAAFAVLSASLGLWPAQKNFGTLLSCSAAVMLGCQFWHVHQGGLYMAWYMPVLVLTIFRPNLEDRVAVSAVIEVRTTWVGRLLAHVSRRRSTD